MSSFNLLSSFSWSLYATRCCAEGTPQCASTCQQFGRLDGKVIGHACVYVHDLRVHVYRLMQMWICVYVYVNMNPLGAIPLVKKDSNKKSVSLEQY